MQKESSKGFGVMKKLLKITFGIISGIIILLAISVYILLNKGYGISVGRYLEAKNGKAMLVCEKSPISMHNRTKRDLVDDLDIGDKILVIHTGIAESYPAQTGVYAVFKISDGTTDDIPQKVVNELIELDWLELEEIK